MPHIRFTVKTFYSPHQFYLNNTFTFASYYTSVDHAWITLTIDIFFQNNIANVSRSFNARNQYQTSMPCEPISHTDTSIAVVHITNNGEMMCVVI